MATPVRPTARHVATRRSLIAILVLVLGCGLQAVANAQSTASSAEARAAQFVLVIDDSASMKKTPDWPGTDPDRLAVFSARSLISMLDDRDEVSVVRLNGPIEGTALPPIQPLRVNRHQMESLLDLQGKLASYNGMVTPCRSALQGVNRILQEAQRPGVAQVVILLTDGACTPEAERPAVEEFLGGLQSREEGLLQFYLLRFKGQPFSQELERLAEVTGGQAFEANPGDPTSILQAFARALSRSQGYESSLLSPMSPRLAAHRGAERVRLLAVAPGAGPDLTFSLHNTRTGVDRNVGRPRAGTHRYGGGRVFRYASLDYTPDAEPVEVRVEGAGETWKVVALPEYRLAVRSGIRLGSCESPGPAISSVEVGATVCAITELVNDRGQVVGGEVSGGDLVARFEMRRPGVSGDVKVDLAANPLSAGEARFGLPRSNLERGDYEFIPRVIVNLSSGEAVPLRGRPLLLEVSSMRMVPEPAAFSCGALQPGSLVQRPFKLTGSFPATSAHVELRGRDTLPSCITAEVNGVPEGKPLKVSPDQPYNVALRVSPYCGPRSLALPYDTALRLVFAAEGGRQLPPIEVPLRFRLDYRITAPPPVVVKVRGGEVGDVPVVIQGNFLQPMELRAVVASPEESEAWPEEGDDLVLGFPGNRRKRVLTESSGGGALRVHDFAVGPGALPLELRALPGRCCAAGSFVTRLGLTAPAGQPLPPGARAPEPIVVPVRIEVEPAGVWACYGPLILAALAILALLLLILYVANMVRNSSFLKTEALAAKLKPLVWTEFGDAVEQKSSKGEVLRLVRQTLPPHRRAAAWLKANPLRFGLPGGRYRESLELLLQANRDVARSQLALLSEGDIQSKAEREPEGYAGRLFAIAAGKIMFLAVPDASGRVSRLVWQDGFLPAGPAVQEGEPPKLKAVKLHKARLLKALEPWETHEEGRPAGWQIG